MRSTARDSIRGEPGCLARRSPRLFGWFRGYARRYVARHFHAVRVSRVGLPPTVPEGLMIVVLNHPSWWDPLIGLVLSDSWPDRLPFAPIAAEALGRYRFFERLGFFGIEPETARGARVFLRTALALADRDDSALWLTAQGRFADPRERPLRLKPGVGRLAARVDRGCILPLALEYPFWDESKPEALARFGPILPLDGTGSPEDWTERISEAL